VCGKSVCGDCSTKTINKDRACDICFYKAKHKVKENIRNELLFQKNKQIKAYQNHLVKEENQRQNMNFLNKGDEKIVTKIVFFLIFSLDFRRIPDTDKINSRFTN